VRRPDQEASLVYLMAVCSFEQTGGEFGIRLRLCEDVKELAMFRTARTVSLGAAADGRCAPSPGSYL
jgi:hypothetical protein